MTRFYKWYRELIVPTAIVSATIMGAGMFSLPYVFNKSGLITGVFYLIIFGLVLAVTHFLYSEVIRATPGDHRLLGYAKTYFGWSGWIISALTTGLGLILISTIFLALSSSFIKLIFPGLTSFQATLLFWFVVSVPLFLKIKKIAILESVVVSSVVFIALGIFIFGFFNFHSSRINLFSPALLLLPYGAVLFSMYGRSAISSVINYAKENNIGRAGIKRAITIGTFVPAVVYSLFVIGALNLSKTVSPDMVSGLVYLPNFVIAIIGCLGIFSLWESSTSLSEENIGVFSRDIGLNEVLAKFVIIFAPLFLYVLGLSNFISLIGIVGGVFITIEGILIVMMWQRAYKKYPLWSYGIIAIFIGGAIYEVIKLI